MTFADRLAKAVAERGPLCVGIDPHPGLLAAWDLPLDATGVERFGRTVVEALGDRVAVLKPQSAFFERFGSRGVAALERVIADGRAAGALMLADVKRGDIGSTAAGYADAYLDPASPLFADAMTAHPYLGVGALGPLFERAAEHSVGVFVLALTSNPEGAAVQRAVGADGRSVAQRVIDDVTALNAVSPGRAGVVVGATLTALDVDLSGLAGPILAPGLGAQGAAPADLPALFGPALASVLPAVSREVLRNGPSPVALQSCAARIADECRTLLQS